MTGLNAIAQWLLGGGGTVLKFILYLLVAWVLVGALPRMRRDAAQKVPQVRGLARDRMRAHSLAAKAAGRGKGAEWWGWTAAWGAVAVGQEGARFGRYLVVSAWHGWGDHRRRVRKLRERHPGRKAGTVLPPGDGPAPPPPPPPPPDGGPAAPDRPGGPSQEAGPSQPAIPDRPGLPYHLEDVTVPPARPPQGDSAPGPADTGAGGNGGAQVFPWPGAGFPPAGEKTGGGTQMPEVNNLEAAIQVVAEMQASAQRALDAATTEKTRAENALKETEQASADLAAAGVKGPAFDAFVHYCDAMEMASVAASSAVTACEMALAAADSAAGALRRHQDAADHLRATGGAAAETEWYGAAG